MDHASIALVLLGAAAGGFVNGLTGFGTGLAALGIWLYALHPPVAATLVVVLSLVGQVQSLPILARTIVWARVVPLMLPGVVGAIAGTLLLTGLPVAALRPLMGGLIAGYATWALLGRAPSAGVARTPWREGAVGLAGGLLGGLAGLSGPVLVIWTDLLGEAKDQRRMVLQSFNLAVLMVALGCHAALGLLTREVVSVAALALPATMTGVWAGGRLYRRLGDRGYARIVMGLLVVSGLALLVAELPGGARQR